MDVAILAKEFPPDVIGGTETQTKRMAEALTTDGHTVTVYTKRYRDHENDLPFEVVRCANLRWSPMLSDLTFFLSMLFALLRRSDEHDCLQCMMIYPMGFLGYVAHRLTGIPYFAWIRGNDFYIGRSIRWKRWTIRRVLNDTLVLVQSSEIRRDVRNEFPKIDPTLRVLGNGVTIPDETAPLDSTTALYVGRLAPKKGVEYLLRAMADVDQGSLVIVGDGPERDRLEAITADMDINVTFEGLVSPDEVDEYYRRASVFVLPSTEGEGLPNVVLEAMAWGLPVITTDSGGLPSVIDDGENGYLVPMRAPEQLAERIETLLSNRERRAVMGRSARHTVREYHSWDRIVAELKETYHVVIDR